MPATRSMKLLLRCSVAMLALLAAPLALALKDTSKAGIDIGGRWNINYTLSDDVEAILAKREQEMMDEMRRLQKKRQSRNPLEQLDNEDDDARPPLFDPNRSRDRRNTREAEQRHMLGVTKVLEITQPPGGATVSIRSDDDARKFDSGSRIQVSMPEGQLADLDAGWDGEWFVIDRRVKGGPRCIEKYRRLKQTDQLETLIHWYGDGPLEGVKVHRIFDRANGAPPPPDPNRGPLR
jgi:hypothetical protein